MQVEPVVLLGRQREQRFLECPLHRAQHIAARPFLFRALLIFDDLRESFLERRELVGEPRKCRVVDHPQPRSRRQVQIRRVDDPLHVAAGPRHARERFDLGDVLENARTRAIECYHVARRMGVQVELRIDLTLRG